MKIVLRASIVVATALVTGLAWASNSTAPSGRRAVTPDVRQPATAPSTDVHLYNLPDGGSVTLASSGLAEYHDRAGWRATLWMPVLSGGQALSAVKWPDVEDVRRRVAEVKRRASVRSLIVVFESATAVPVGARAAPNQAHEPALTTDPAIDAQLRAAGARSLAPMLAVASTSATRSGLDLSRAYVVDVTAPDPVSAARRLSSTPGVVYAAPNWTIESMAVGAKRIPREVLTGVRANVSAAASAPGSIPSNYAISSSLESYLNANGVNALGDFVDLARRFRQLPGHGTIITDVALGDLTDQSMADAGDPYVQINGPTTVVKGGQRFLDFPSLPLIPTYTVDPTGAVDPLGSVEGVDPTLGEVLLDFSVMAPLPHDRQRSENPGSGFTDLLGIAPGAQYRLVVPAEPTNANILVALAAAAQQQPRPDVITLSLGYGLDAYGFPGRYFEDDPLALAVVQSIVSAGVIVTIAANDGTRLFTPAAVGADGGAAPINVPTRHETPTSVADDGFSTIPTVVPDSGAIAVGGATLDDIFSAPPQWTDALSRQNAFPATRLNGGTNFASGFGTRVNLSAPSDNIPALAHICESPPCAAQDAETVLEGGTSGSAPMVAAAAAVMRQVARLTGSDLSAAEVRRLLAETGRRLPNPPQADRELQVGPLLDVTRAVEALMSRRGVAQSSSQVVRLGVAQRQEMGGLGASFIEATDSSAIDLTGPPSLSGVPTGQNAASLITISADVIGSPDRTGLSYQWTIGERIFPPYTAPWIRLFPAEILAASGQALVGNGTRSVPVTLEVLRGGTTVAKASTVLGFGPSDGTYAEALAPRVEPILQQGRNIRVSYDISHVRTLNAPQLVVSAIDHWSPVGAPIFRPAWTTPVTNLTGELVIPASAFAAGSGVYGIGVNQDSTVSGPIYGEFSTLQLADSDAVDCARTECREPSRPEAPTVAGEGASTFGHTLAVTRANPRFQVQWDVSRIPGAHDAMLEVSAPAPSIWGLYNTFTNPNGDGRDNNGVDSPSIAYVALPGATGTTTLDALALGVPTSMFYTIRVLAADRGGRVLGQASPESSLSFDDGLPPNGGVIVDFDVRSPHGPAAVAVAQFDQTDAELSSTVFAYDPASGTYGHSIASDNSGSLDYHAMGSDSALGRSLVVALSNTSTDQYLNIHDSRTGALIASTDVDASSSESIVGVRVDGVRHRAAVLGWNAADSSDVVLAFDLGNASLGSPIFADVGTSDTALFTDLDLDAATGRVLPTHVNPGDLCLLSRQSGITSVDLDAQTAEPVVPLSHCATSIAADQRGAKAYALVGPALSFALLSPARDVTVDQHLLTSSSSVALGASAGLFSVVDPTHNLLLVAFVAPENYELDNNASSKVGVFDLDTGRRLSLISGFNLLYAAQDLNQNYFFQSERGLQIDPKTRTGWTYGPFAQEIAQFKY